MTLKQRIRNYSLKKLGKSKKPGIPYPGYEAIKEVVIIFEKGPADQAVQNFARQLKTDHKKVQLMAYIPQKRKEIIEHQPFEYFCKDDINWYGRPKPEVLTSFGKNRPDVLISINEKGESPLQFLAIACNANFSIGLKKTALQIYDLQVAHPKGQDFTSVFKEVDYYLKFINQ